MRRLNLFQEIYDNHVFIGPGNVFAQSFISDFDNLAGVRFPIFNPNLGGKQLYLIRISDANNNVLRQEAVSESNLGWGGDFRYDFPAIPEAKKKTFILSISFSGENEEDSTNIQEINNLPVGK